MAQAGLKPIVLVSEQLHVPRFDETGDGYMLAPQLDYLEIAQRIDGRVVGRGLSDSAILAPILSLEKILKVDLVEALSAFSSVGKKNLLLSTSEKTGLPMAALLSVSRQQNPHILISHHISSRNKSRLFRFWPLYKSFSKLIFVSQPQARYAKDVLGISPDKITFVFDKVDHRFFAPQPVRTEDFILAVGNEARDYQSLSTAIADTGLRLVVVASSPWSRSQPGITPHDNLTLLGRISYQELRDLYARARLVVLPLKDVDYAAGANTTLETMAMGKPLILSESSGLEGYVIHDQTGWVVPSGDPPALRDAIQRLWTDPKAIQRLGTNARQAVLDQMNIQIYTDKIVEIIQNCLGEKDCGLSPRAKIVNVHR